MPVPFMRRVEAAAQQPDSAVSPSKAPKKAPATAPPKAPGNQGRTWPVPRTSVL